MAWVTKPFSVAFRQKMVARLSGKDAPSARQLALETGVRQQTLSRWLQEANNLPIMPTKHPRRDWSVEKKILILAKASALSGADLTDLLQREGVLRAEYEQWRLALSEGASLAIVRRIRALERELARKEKALAEAAALLVLKKKVQALEEDEDVDSDEESEP